MCSDKGPWKQPEIVKMVQNGIHKCSRKPGLQGLGAALNIGPSTPKLNHALSRFREEVSLAKNPEASFRLKDSASMVGKSVDSSWPMATGNVKFALSSAKSSKNLAGDCFARNDACKLPEGFGYQIMAAILTFLMGIVAMVRLTRSMPKRLTDSTFYSSTVCDGDTMVKGQGSSHAAISGSDLMTVMTVLNMKPAAVPAQKEEMLNTALGLVGALEKDLMATKQALEESLTRQEELLGSLDKKKKRKNNKKKKMVVMQFNIW